MRTFKLNERFILFGIIAAVLFAVTPNASMPAGGPEPGAGCGLEGLKYVAPPYIGPVTITFNDDDNSFGPC